MSQELRNGGTLSGSLGARDETEGGIKDLVIKVLSLDRVKYAEKPPLKRVVRSHRAHQPVVPAPARP